MRRVFRSGTARGQRGSVAVDSAFLLPVILTAAMLVFEIAHYALVIIIGGLALNTALNGLRERSDAAFAQGGDVGALIKADMLIAAYGYLNAGDLSVRTRTYRSLAELGGATSDAEKNPDFPMLTVEVVVDQDWITALPTFLGLPERFSHTYRQVWGTPYRPARRAS